MASFLGYVNFYRRFVPKLAELAVPMYALTKKEITFNWDEDCQNNGFEAIKKLVAQKPILRQPKWDQVFHVHVDASRLALGAILAQPDGETDFPMYYASRRFSQAEKAYTTTEREALGMIFSVQKFRHYLLGNFFVFYVDHQALLYLINKVVIQGRLSRWMLLLQEYDFKIIPAFKRPANALYNGGGSVVPAECVDNKLHIILLPGSVAILDIFFARFTIKYICIRA